MKKVSVESVSVLSNVALNVLVFYRLSENSSQLETFKLKALQLTVRLFSILQSTILTTIIRQTPFAADRSYETITQRPLIERILQTSNAHFFGRD